MKRLDCELSPLTRSPWHHWRMPLALGVISAIVIFWRFQLAAEVHALVQDRDALTHPAQQRLQPAALAPADSPAVIAALNVIAAELTYPWEGIPLSLRKYAGAAIHLENIQHHILQPAVTIRGLAGSSRDALVFAQRLGDSAEWDQVLPVEVTPANDRLQVRFEITATWRPRP